MNLSEAIREGSKKSAQAFGTTEDEIGRTCALGAAIKCDGGHIYSIGEKWGDLHLVIAPPCGCLHLPAQHVQLDGAYPDASFAVSIAHLNDVHRWTREAIAEWVEVVEKDLQKMRHKIAPPMEPIKGEVKVEPVEPVRVTV